ncbi:type 1 glutamine amidotransferase [bacterium]|nr:MAG: type 1 glutamine amidotransferase [bacterium]
MKLKSKRIAILVENLYQEHELWYPYYRMLEEGADVVIVGPKAGTYTSKYGYPVQVDLAADQVRAADFHAVIIPGGYAPDHMRRHKAMVDLVRDSVNEGQVVAAICHAGWMLASADVLEGRTVTGFFAIRDDLVHAGAQFVDEEVVQDGNLITSRKPDDLPAFCRTIIAALS